MLILAALSPTNVAVADDRPPVYQILKQDDTLEARAAFWLYLYKTLTDAGVDPNYCKFPTKYVTTRDPTPLRLRYLGLKEKARPEWVLFRMPGQMWAAGIPAMAKNFGEPTVYKLGPPHGEDAEACWMFPHAFGYGVLAITITGGTASEPGVNEIRRMYKKQ